MKSRLFNSMVVLFLILWGVSGCGDDEPAAGPAGGGESDDGFRDLGYEPDLADAGEDSPITDDTGTDDTGDDTTTDDTSEDSTAEEICDNGFDDDGDDREDCNDPDCIDDPFCDTEPTDEICDNEIDDDRDGLPDCFDGDCASDPACLPDTAEICDNGIDDDEDGATDCDDADCLSFCTDGGTEVPDDMFGDFGAILCLIMCLADPVDPMGCMMGCFTGGAGGSSETNCTDGLDNDGNGMTDCEEMYCLMNEPTCLGY